MTLNHGAMRSNFSLTTEQKQDARSALKLLSGTGLTLEACVRMALQLKDGTTVASVAWDVACERFLRDCIRRGLRRHTLEFYRVNLEMASVAFGGKALGDIKRADLVAYLRREKTPHKLRAIRAMLRWCVAQEPPLLASDPTQGIAKSVSYHRAKGHVAEYLSVEQVRTVFAAAFDHHKAALALLFFAGVRPQELASQEKPPMLWSQIDLAAKTIRINSDQSKTHRPRVIEGLPPNIWTWLQAHKGEPDKPVLPTQVRCATLAARRALGLPEWPKDIARHSFATYHVALEKQPGLTALILGHEGNTSMLYSHYRGLATEAQAREYFGIVA